MYPGTATASQRRASLPRDAGSNAFRRAREEPSATDSTHATSAADGCPYRSAQAPRSQIQAQSRGCPSRRRASAEAARNSPSSAEAKYDDGRWPPPPSPPPTRRRET